MGVQSREMCHCSQFNLCKGEIAAGRESASLSASSRRDGKALSWPCLEEGVVPLCMVHMALGKKEGV